MTQPVPQPLRCHFVEIHTTAGQFLESSGPWATVDGTNQEMRRLRAKYGDDTFFTLVPTEAKRPAS